jgi:hypothetical protein
MAKQVTRENFLRKLIRDSISKRRAAMTYALAREFENVLFNHQKSLKSQTKTQSDQRPWITIGSLSQLRAEVGGRFHRGDSLEKTELNIEAWSELLSWISKQGYEARLLGEDQEGEFEIRKS